MTSIPPPEFVTTGRPASAPPPPVESPAPGKPIALPFFVLGLLLSFVVPVAGVIFAILFLVRSDRPRAAMCLAAVGARVISIVAFGL